MHESIANGTIFRVGILSDTHSHLDRGVFHHFSNCNEIWHAGDIGDVAVLEELNQFKPTVAVFGNIDDTAIRKNIPENQLLERNGAKIFITHIAGQPPRYNARVTDLIRSEKPSILVCGHSHILKVIPDKVHNLLFINPGAAGIQGFHRTKTLIRMEINNGRPTQLEVIELGPRGKI